jgi:hypothetical protein
MGEQTSRIGVRIMLALLFVSTIGFAWNLYIMQEAIVVLLLLTVLTATILALAIVFILILEGISRAVLWKKRAVASLDGLSPQASHPEKVVSHAKP